MNTTRDDFQLYLVQPEKFESSYASMFKINNGTPINAAQVLSDKTKFDSFCALFPVLEDEQQWDYFSQSFCDIVKVHDLQEVVDANYVPQTKEQQVLFEDKQALLWFVLVAMLKTEFGSTCVMKSDNCHDGQAVFKEMVEHMAPSILSGPVDHPLHDTMGCDVE